MEGGTLAHGVRRTDVWPGARRGAAVWRAMSTGETFLWGGYGYDATRMGDLSDMWVWKGASVSAVASAPTAVDQPSSATWPGARHGAQTWTAKCGGGSELLYMWGGFGRGMDLYDMWVFDPLKRQWSLVGVSSSPQGRSHAATWSVGCTLWMFGGWGKDGIYSDLWSFENGVWTKRSDAAGPLPRYGAVSWVNASDSSLHLWGGYASGNEPYASYMADHWVMALGGDSFKLVGGSVEGPNWSSSSCLAGGRVNAAVWMSSSKVWIFGGDGVGRSSVGFLNDLYEIGGGGGSSCGKSVQYPKMMYGGGISTSGGGGGNGGMAAVAASVVGVVVVAAIVVIIVWVFKKRSASSASSDLLQNAKMMHAASTSTTFDPLSPGTPSTPTPLIPTAELRRQRLEDFE